MKADSDSGSNFKNPGAILCYIELLKRKSQKSYMGYGKFEYDNDFIFLNARWTARLAIENESN